MTWSPSELETQADRADVFVEDEVISSNEGNPVLAVVTLTL